jgi:dihydroorotate dehydrogenase (fumarate)
VVKALLAGADVVQVVTALLRHGPREMAVLLAGLRRWMEEHEYESVSQVRGALSLRHCPDPEAYERGNYLRSLQLWRD